jgi:hypothetical protein
MDDVPIAQTIYLRRGERASQTLSKERSGTIIYSGNLGNQEKEVLRAR